ncbi:serine hydrolase [Actinomadura rupiterrae]|uniref:serine hydrolase n=1 Tax=Actinomadura rupiterrae TaxID=559627 RepID=UPI0020A5FD01|nr:serine hydrolase [Actinomadura rupiterrae]MCP2335135.1 hypothetical protein [Actinomadura rupiterrae]
MNRPTTRRTTLPKPGRTAQPKPGRTAQPETGRAAVADARRASSPKGRASRPGGVARLAAVAAAVLAGVTACATSAPVQSAAGGRTAAGKAADKQLQWIVQASHHLPISDADAQTHIEPATLRTLGGAGGLNKSLRRIGPLSPELPPVGARGRAVGWFNGARKTTLLGTAATNASGQIAGLYFAKQPGSWSELDGEMRKQAPDVAFATAEIGKDGRCKVLHGVNADTPRPLGSAFKLYVLGALSDAVAAHRVSWNTKQPIMDAWKSLPSGVLQDKPAGTEFTLANYAEHMIAISDNTAADHLINRLGRDAVERAVPAMGNRHPQGMLPFLTTREVFALKGSDYPATAKSYLALPPAKRYGALPPLDVTPTSKLRAWQEPRDIDTIEWMASPNDMCAAFKGLRDRAAKPGQAEVGKALSMNDGGIELDPKTYRTVWFKGGSEPGVLTGNYMARTASGRTVVTSVMMSNPKAVIPGTTELNMLAFARAGFKLAEASDA